MIKTFSKSPGIIKNSAIKSSTYTFKNFQKELFDEGKFNGEERPEKIQDNRAKKYLVKLLEIRREM